MTPSAEAASSAQREPLTLAPTLFIGLGGTGKEVLLRVRRMFFERFGCSTLEGRDYFRFPIIGYLVVDTNDEELDNIHGKKERDQLTPFVRQNIALKRGGAVPEAVVCSISAKEFHEYFQNRQHFGHIFSWMPDGMEQHTHKAVEKGAGQIRPFGRLAFFHSFLGTSDRPGIRPTLETHLKEVVRFAAIPELCQAWLKDIKEGAQVDPNRIEVVLVYSLAGGTGAGMFLDMAFLVQHVLQEQYRTALTHITHIAVLPEVMAGSEGPLHGNPQQLHRVKENAFAALRELEYFANIRRTRYDLSIPPPADANSPEGLRYHVQWDPNAPAVNVTETPWNTYYLLGASNDSLPEMALPPYEINQMIAEYLFLDFDPSNFGTQKRSARSNLLGQTLSSYADEVKEASDKPLFTHYLSRKFSIFGLSQIHFDRLRMRRAAAHLLAAMLVEKRWLRETELNEGSYQQFAKEDLVGSANGNPNLVTSTGAGQPGLSISYSSIGALVVRKDGFDSDVSVWDAIEEQRKGMRRDIESGKIDALRTGRDLVSDWLTARLGDIARRTEGGREAGVALATFADNKTRLKLTIDDRLRQLVLYRVEGLGLAGTLRLLKAYDSVLKNEAARAEGEAKRAGPRMPDPSDRLLEARSLPLYSGTAARLELLRALNQSSAYLRDTFRRAAAPSVEECLDLAVLRVSVTARDGSYYNLLTRFARILKPAGGQGQGVLPYLKSRYEELRKDTGSVGRSLALLEKLGDDEYTKRIRKALARSETRDEFDWDEVERRMFERLAQRPGFSKVKGIGDLIFHYLDIQSTDLPNDERIEELASELTAACEALLEKFATETTALTLFLDKRNDQAECLTQLRTYSAPYLAKNKSVLISPQVNVNTFLYLGMAEHGTDRGRKFREMLLKLEDKGGQKLEGMRDFAMKDDAIVLYQEKAGVPLCYYQGLDAIGRLYDEQKDRARGEMHLDRRLIENLVEIRSIEPSRGVAMSHAIELALAAAITGRLRHDRRTKSFQMTSREYGLSQPLGRNLDEVARLLTAEYNRPSMTDLTKQHEDWLDLHSRENDGEMVAILWCAIYWLFREVRERIQAWTALRPEDETGRPRVHPLLPILKDRMRRKVRDRLSGIRGSERWVEPFEKLEENMEDNLNRTDDERDRAWREWQENVKGCFEVISTELPIPVIPTVASFPRPPEGAAAAGNGATGTDSRVGA